MKTVTFRRGVNASHWIGQMKPGTWAEPEVFNPDDVRWIADQGFDHIRVPVDGRVLLDAEGKLKSDLLDPFRTLVGWAEASDLGVIFDMHFLEGNDFVSLDGFVNQLFTDVALQDRAASLWKQVAQFLSDLDAERLRFEILNEAVADDPEDLNRLYQKILPEIRQSNPDRVVYLASNRWGKFSTAPDLWLPTDDRNIHATFHFYEPGIFTHQNAHWVDLPKYDTRVIDFPSRVDGLAERYPEGHEARTFDGKVLDRDFVEEQFDHLEAWRKGTTLAPEQILIGEFGAFKMAPADGRLRYVRAVAAASESRGYGWTVWDYRGSFGVRDHENQDTPILAGLREVMA